MKADRISGTIWLLFSLAVIEESYRLGLGSLRTPDAGFLPFVAAMTLGILSLLLLLSTVGEKQRRTGRAGDLSFNRPRLPKVFYILASLFVYALLLSTLGFILCTAIFIVFLLVAIERQRWPVVIGTAILVPFISYLIFDIWLKMNLPKGFLSY